MRFIRRRRVSPGVHIAAALIFLLSTAAAGEAQVPSDTGLRESLSEEEYVSSCEQVAVSALTERADDMTGRQVTITGQILVWEVREDAGTVTHLIIAVDDPINTLPSGQLPVYVVYRGTIKSFIYDTISIYGDVYGNDVYQSVAIQEKTLPRIDAKYIDE